MMDKYLLPLKKTVKEVISHMEEENLKAVIIIGEGNKLEGLFSLGDMRHFFLCGGDLNANIAEAMNKNPQVFTSLEEVECVKKNKKMVIYPIVNDLKVVIDVVTERMEEKEVISEALAEVPLVIMAGGKGTRLYPYTKILPKALIPIGDYTITERIVKSFQRYGCKEVFMILNHKANMIKAYFGELDKQYTMSFIEEEVFLGTGGGLSLLKGKVNTTFFLSNCDILLNADLECIYKTHKIKGNKITFVCAMKDVQIPYGVIETDEDGFVRNFKEKPEFSFLTNTGVYMIEPDVINDLREDEFIHLPDIAQRYMENGEKVGVFPISEKSWMDMGQFTEMEAMIKALGV